MAKVIIDAKIATGETVIEDGYIRFTDKILDVGPMAEFQNKESDEVISGRGKVIVPGFIEVHCHGGYGIDTMDADPEKINEMVHKISYHEGVTSFFPTTITQSVENIENALKGVKEASKSNKVIQGINMEGPFLDVEKKGAQPEKYIIDPDINLLKEWDEVSGHMIRVITYAPEKPGARELEDYCIAHNIVPSIGHTKATREECKQAKGSHITHLYQMMTSVVHREPGVVGHAFLEDNIYCEMIMDGFHNCPDSLEIAYRAIGPHRMELVTDAMRKKGMGDGVSELGGQRVTVKGIQARLDDGTIAGSVLPYNVAFENCMKFTDAGLPEAVLMSSVNAAKEFCLTTKGGLQEGKDADINVLDNNYKLEQTLSYGELVKE